MVVNVLVCVFTPSPKDHDHGPDADELTENVNADPVVPLGDTFKNAAAGVGVELGGVPPPLPGPCGATSECVLSDPDVAVTVAVSVAVRVVTARPSAPVLAITGESDPTVVVNTTAILASGAPLTFCTRAMTVPAFALKVSAEGDERSIGVGGG